MADDTKSNLLALGRTRDRVIDLLTDGFANDVLELEEYEERVDRAHRATSVDELRALTHDLDAGDAFAETGQGALTRVDPDAIAAPAPRTALAVSRPAKKSAIAILGGVERKGSWVAPAQLNVVTVLGGAEIDLREAVLPPGVTEIKIRAFLGGANIIVPPDVSVESDGIAILGGFEDKHRSSLTPDPDRPLIRISGLAILGGVEITTRLPNETAWQASRRRREERKQLAKARERELGSGERKRLGAGEPDDDD